MHCRKLSFLPFLLADRRASGTPHRGVAIDYHQYFLLI